MRENPAISDWVPISEGSTEGLLGGWLAQRCGGGGSRPNFYCLPCVPSSFRALRMPDKSFWKSGMIRFERIAVRTDLESLRAANDHACLSRIPLNGSLLSYHRSNKPARV